MEVNVGGGKIGSWMGGNLMFDINVTLEATRYLSQKNVLSSIAERNVCDW